jgi:hypothetical protein
VFATKDTEERRGEERSFRFLGSKPLHPSHES